MPILPRNATLQGLQEYVAQSEGERGFADQTALQKCLLLGEETGELFKAVRRCSDIKVDPESSVHQVGEELADILMFVFAIANRFEVDLEVALREKEEKNSRRIWR